MSNKIYPILVQEKSNFFTQQSKSSDQVLPQYITDIFQNFTQLVPISNPQTKKILLNSKLKLRGISIWMKILNQIRQYGTTSQLINVRNQLKQNYHALIKKRALKIHQDSPKQTKIGLLFHPNSLFSQIWNVVVLLLLIYVFTAMPYIMAFKDVEIGSDLFWFELCIDFLFFFDILITLNTAILNDSGYVETSRTRIFQNYLCGMLLIDILAILPFYLISQDGSAGRSNSLIRFIRITKLARIFRGSKILHVIKNISKSERMNKLIKLIKTYDGITRLVTAVYIVLIMAHVTACMWYFMAKIEGFSYDTWVVRHGFSDASEGKLYLACLYFSFAILTTVGFGDIHAYTDSQMFVCIIWMLLGIGFYSFVIGTLTSVLSSMDAKDTVVKEKLNLVDDFASQFALAQDISNEMKNAIKKGGNIGNVSEAERARLISILPKDLRYTVAMNMFKGAAQEIPFFTNQDKVFVSAVVPRLEFQVKKERRIVFQKNDQADQMYFIVKGKVNYVIGRENTVFKGILAGSYFGEIELIQKCPRKYTVITDNQCEFLVMNSYIFNQVLKQYPLIGSQMTKLAKIKNRINLENAERVRYLLMNLKDRTQTIEFQKKKTTKIFKTRLSVPKIQNLTSELILLEDRTKNLQKRLKKAL